MIFSAPPLCLPTQPRHLVAILTKKQVTYSSNFRFLNITAILNPKKICCIDHSMVTSVSSRILITQVSCWKTWSSQPCAGSYQKFPTTDTETVVQLIHTAASSHTPHARPGVRESGRSANQKTGTGATEQSHGRTESRQKKQW